MHRQGAPYYFITLIIFGLSTIQASSQNNTLYFQYPVPQAIHLNPALFYRCRTYVELPVVSSVRYAYNNSGFGYHDAFRYGSGSDVDSIIIDIDNLDKKLKKRNYVRNDASINFAGAGFRLLEDYYVHFNISNYTETRVGIPGDLVSLKDGNWDIDANEPRDINLSGLGVNGTNYLQFAAGVSTEIMTGLYVGVTLKYLKGAGNISSQKTDLTIETEGDPIRVIANTEYSVRTAFPMRITLDTLGYVSEVDLDPASSNIVRNYLLNKNHGGAIDLGVIYEYDEDLTLAASLINLGGIRWGSNVHRFDARGSVDFEGFDLREIFESGGNTDFIQALGDSLAEAFQFETSNKPYWSALTPTLYTGAAYQILPGVQVSGLVRTEFFDRRPHFSLTLAGMYSPLPFLHGTLSYSVMNYKLTQLGFGLVMGGRGAQFYLVSDHIPWRWVRDTSTGAVWPYNARTTNIRFGVNLIFGCEERQKGKYGKPPHIGRKRGRYCPVYD